LNLYFVKDYKAYGYCPNPVDMVGVEDKVEQSGCMIQAATVPGGWAPADANQGKTAVHEVGHWFGLYHTFQKGCDGKTDANAKASPEPIDQNTGDVMTGDRVQDTPAHTETRGCPSEAPDTCPEHQGRDPINNYMSYSSDECLKEFTPGQV
jgi:hypothetical protein